MLKLCNLLLYRTTIIDIKTIYTSEFDTDGPQSGRSDCNLRDKTATVCAGNDFIDL